MTESQPLKTETPMDISRNPPRRIWWFLLLAVILLAPVTAGGIFWKLSLSPERCYRRGREALLVGDHKAVIRESNRLIKTTDFKPHGHLLAGLLFVDERRLEKAIPELILAAECDAIAIDAMTAAAKCYYLSGRFLFTVGTANAVLEKDPEAIDARRLAGRGLL